MSQTMSQTYEALVAHAELELELAGRGDIEGLLELGERWQALVASLPERPSPLAARSIERAQLIHARTRIDLIRLQESLRSELETIARARRTAEGYRGPGTAVPGLDASA